LNIAITGDVSDFKRATAEAEASTAKLEKQVSKSSDSMTSKMTGFGKAAVAGLAALGGAVAIGGITKAIDGAKELQQSVGGTTAVFKDNADAVSDFAKSASDSVGLSENDARQMTTILGAALKGYGYSVDEAAQKSIQLTKIGADLAATYGGTSRDAVTALSAALRGEFDPLERFGIAINQTLINQKAVAMGLATSTAHVDQHARAQAALALITERSADAQGQFGRETGTAAGAAEIAAARWENATAKFGEKMLPIYTAAVEWLSDKIPTAVDQLTKKFEDVADAWKRLLKDFGFGDQTEGQGPGGANLLEGFAGGADPRNPGAMSSKGEKTSNIGTFLDQQKTSGPFAWISQMINSGDNNTAREQFIEGLHRIGAAIESVEVHIDAVMQVFPIFTNTIGQFAAEATLRMQGLINGFQAIWSGFGATVSQAWEHISAIMSAGWQAIQGLFSAGLAFIKGDWESVWNGMKDFLGGIWDGIGAGISAMGDQVGGALKAAAHIGAAALNSLIEFWNGLAIPAVHIPLPFDRSFDAGPFDLPDIPTVPAFHSGGVYSAPTPGGEGLALLRDQERVVTPEQAQQPIVLTLDGYTVARALVPHLDQHEKTWR
jgi:hypothetical protein